MLSQLLERRAASYSGGHPRDPALADFLGGAKTRAGVSVTESRALKILTAYNCISLIGGILSSFPKHLFDFDTRDRSSNRDLERVLGTEPNPEMSGLVFWESRICLLLSRGNSYAEIELNNGGDCIGLWPLPAKTRPVRLPSREIVYDFTISGKPFRLPAERVLHLRLMSEDGLVGLSPIKLAAERIGSAIAAEQTADDFFASGGIPFGAISYPMPMTNEGLGDAAESLDERRRVLTMTDRIIMLEEGETWQNIGISNEDAQLLETQKWNRLQIASIWNVKGHMINIVDDVNRSTSEQLGREFHDYTIAPLKVRIEQEVNRKVLNPRQRRASYWEIIAEGLLRANYLDRMEGATKEIGSGISTINEKRKQENKPPVEGGDEPLVQLNLVPVKMLTEALRGNGDPLRSHLRALGASGMVDERGAIRVAPAAPVALIENKSEESATENTEDAEKERRAKEERALRTRRRIRKSFLRLFEESAGRVVKREKADVMKAARKHLDRRDANGLLEFIREFYKKHEGFTDRTMRGVIASFADEIGASASSEIGADLEDFSSFAAGYSERLGIRHSTRALGELEELIRATAAEELFDKLSSTMDRWEENLPRRMASEEVVRIDGAVSRQVFASAGRSMVWRKSGETCPFCSQLDGRRVDGSGAFLDHGTLIDPRGDRPDLHVNARIGHPPLHEGCDCSIVAG